MAIVERTGKKGRNLPGGVTRLIAGPEGAVEM